MNGEMLSEAMSEVGEELLWEAEQTGGGKIWTRLLIPAAACLIVLFGVFFYAGNKKPTASVGGRPLDAEGITLSPAALPDAVSYMAADTRQRAAACFDIPLSISSYGRTKISVTEGTIAVRDKAGELEEQGDAFCFQNSAEIVWMVLPEGEKDCQMIIKGLFSESTILLKYDENRQEWIITEEK